MKLDNEQDRQLLHGLIQSAQIQGSSVLLVADLVRRIQMAEVDAPKPADPNPDLPT